MSHIDIRMNRRELEYYDISYNRFNEEYCFYCNNGDYMSINIVKFNFQRFMNLDDLYCKITQ
jgi:hypothetical protein